MIRHEARLFFGALGFFTRLPTPAWVGHTAPPLAQASRYLPAIGLLVGGASGLAYWLGVYCWPPGLAVLLALATGLGLTGAFHEDGLADTADGLGGGWDKTRILAIMKDSRIGSFGVLALVLCLAAKFQALLALTAHGPLAMCSLLLGGHALSRLAAISLMTRLDYAREAADESSKARPLVGRLGTGGWLFAALWAVLPLFWLPPVASLAGLFGALLVTLWLARLCQRWLGGYTGDTLGAVQQLSELAFYLGVLAVWPA